MVRAIHRLEVASSALWPGNQGSSLPADFLRTSPRPADRAPVAGASGLAPTAAIGTAPKKDRRGPPGIRHLGAVVAAVYAALSDPVAASDEAAREQRAAQVRRAGMIAACGALAAVLIYSIFPVGLYLDQRVASDRARERLEVISEENDRLAERADELRDPETVEEIARRDYGLVLPGEEPYGVLPPPAETTTTAPTTTLPTPP